jgi:hypothetical protein
MQETIKRDNFPRYICADPKACFFKEGNADRECIGCPRLRIE